MMSPVFYDGRGKTRVRIVMNGEYEYSISRQAAILFRNQKIEIKTLRFLFSGPAILII